MVQTVISGSSAYCSIAQVLSRYDWNTLADLLARKTGVGSQATLTKLTLSQVQSSTDLTTYLQEAAGMIEIACFKGGRYTTTDLAALASTNAGEFLAGVNADLGVWRAYDSRPDRRAEMPERCKVAWGLLQELEQGAKIFPFQESADAGRMAEETPRHAPIVRKASRYFGSAADQFDYQDWENL